MVASAKTSGASPSTLSGKHLLGLTYPKHRGDPETPCEQEVAVHYILAAYCERIYKVAPDGTVLKLTLA